MILVTALVLVSSALSVVYLWKIVEILWQRPEEDEAPLQGDETPALYLPLWILTIANLWLGIAPAPLVDAANRAAMHLVGGIS